MAMSLGKSLHAIRFCYLGGTPKNAQQQAQEVVGEWEAHHPRQLPHPRMRYGPKGNWIEDFANWPGSAAAIVRFTRRYGPLNRMAEHGGSFRFTTGEWQDLQRQFRETWEALMPVAGRPIRLWPGAEFEPEPGERLMIVYGELTYQASTLYRFLLLELYATPYERLRKCGCPDCPNPYFVARHLGQNYCSPSCAAWGRRHAKLEWWHKWRGRKG